MDPACLVPALGLQTAPPSLPHCHPLQHRECSQLPWEKGSPVFLRKNPLPSFPKSLNPSLSSPNPTSKIRVKETRAGRGCHPPSLWRQSEAGGRLRPQACQLISLCSVCRHAYVLAGTTAPETLECGLPGDMAVVTADACVCPSLHRGSGKEWRLFEGSQLFRAQRCSVSVIATCTGHHL